ncbi:hypothetical protein LUZ63_000901 [Rhynchospora breviuscula]|uniref:Uncharacterized protein n=1 Tax=Rhynchospora breviuscula TaxID=2022672 RepID=A0A9Q0CWT1_9POAL|nr:hypothetical protein LUZ63_000901 [Rhynchospora breviuscula]
MGNAFVKRPKVTGVDRAILTLKTQRRKLKTQRRKLGQYQQQLKTVIDAEVKAGKGLKAPKRKARALIALKKNSCLVSTVDGWLMNVEQQLADIELASKRKAVFDNHTKAGSNAIKADVQKAESNAIKAIQSEINIDDFQKLMFETAEAYQEEINAVLHISAHLSAHLSAEEEQEVMDEFEKLEEEMFIEDLPITPVEPVTVDKKDEIIEEHLPNEKVDEIVLPVVPKTPVQFSGQSSTSEIEKVFEEPLPARRRKEPETGRPE